MAHIDAALMLQILDIPKRQGKPDVQHLHEANDLGTRFEVTKGTAFWGCHKLRVSAPPQGKVL